AARPSSCAPAPSPAWMRCAGLTSSAFLSSRYRPISVRYTSRRSSVSGRARLARDMRTPVSAAKTERSNLQPRSPPCSEAQARFELDPLADSRAAHVADLGREKV